MNQLRELLAAATPRPWACHPPEGRFIQFGGEGAMERSGYFENEPDAALIVALVNQADSLLAVAEAAQAFVARAKAAGVLETGREIATLEKALARLTGETTSE